MEGGWLRCNLHCILRQHFEKCYIIMSFDRECLLCFMYTTDLVNFSDIYYLFTYLLFFFFGGGGGGGTSWPLKPPEQE